VVVVEDTVKVTLNASQVSFLERKLRLKPQEDMAPKTARAYIESWLGSIVEHKHYFTALKKLGKERVDAGQLLKHTLNTLLTYGSSAQTNSCTSLSQFYANMFPGFVDL
jgi:hypothetical protein